MGQPFPNEQPLSTHDTIALAEQEVFSGFDEELQNTSLGASQTWRDYDFKRAGNNGQIVLAKPLKAGSLWAVDITSGSPTQGEWVENAAYDPATGGIDDSNQGQPQATTGPAGQCSTCGHVHVGQGKFCPICGGALTQGVAVTAPLGSLGALGSALSPPGPPAPPTAGQLQPGQSPQAGAGHIPPPAHINPNRMEGRPKKEVVVPEGMKVTKSTGFMDGLDAMLDAAEKAGVDEQK